MLSAGAYAAGHAKLQAALAEHGPEHAWPSEIAVVEIWAQKLGKGKVGLKGKPS